MGFGRWNLVAFGAFGAILVIAVVLTVLTLFAWRTGHSEYTFMEVQEVIRLARDDQLEKILVDGNKYTAISRSGMRVEVLTARGENLREELRRAGVEDVDALFSDP